MSLMATAIGGLVSVAPEIAGWLGGEDAEKTAEDVANVAKKVTGQEDTQAAVDQIKQDPEQARKFQEAMQSFRVKMQQEVTKRQETVNKTMRAEAKSESWPQYSWRPFNGFMFGITLFGIHFVLPLLKVEVQPINPTVLSLWAGVLGVVGYQRGKEKRAKLGDLNSEGLMERVAKVVKGK